MEENKHETKGFTLAAARMARLRCLVCASAGAVSSPGPLTELTRTQCRPVIASMSKLARPSIPTKRPFTKLSGFIHETINHSPGEYVRGDVTTNGIESVFAVLKRGLVGVYHHASPKHLDRYVDEFAFRLNEGNVKNHTMTRLDSFVHGTAGKRLTYKGLIQ